MSDSPDDVQRRAAEPGVEHLDSSPGSAAWDAGTTGGAADPVAGHGRRRRGLVVGAVLAVAVMAGGVAYGVGQLSGGGAQPDDVLPASALGIVSVDLDPSAGQKVDAVRFARRFPSLASRVGQGDDLRKALFDAVSDSAQVKGSWKDVAPWLGERAALALVPAADELDDPQPVAVLAVTDEDRARAALPTVLPEASCQVANGFALCAHDAATVQRAVSDAAKRSLADDPTYSGDLEALGDRGIVAAWFDLGRVKSAAPDLLSGMGGVTGSLAGAASDLKGRYVAAVRFDGPHLELAAHVEGAGLPRLTGSADAGSLPQSTLVAVGLGDAGSAVTSAWRRLEDAASAMGGADRLRDEVSSVESTYGVTLPDDVAAAVGDQLTLAVGPGSSTPQLAVRVTGTPDSVQRLLGAVERASGSAPATATSGGATVVATDHGYATAVAQGDGLATTDRFRDAVEDADGAQVVLFVDVAGLVSSYGQRFDLDATAMADVKPLDALGVSVRSGADGLDVRARLVTR